MKFCRTLWAGLVGLLLPMFSANAAPAAAVPELPMRVGLGDFLY